MFKNIIVFVALIVALASAQVTLTPGYKYSSSTSFRSWTYFALPLSESTINYVQFVTTVDSGTPFYYVSIGSYPTFQNNIWKYENVTGGPVNKYIFNPNIDLRTGNYTNTVLYFGVYGYTNTKYSVTAYTQGPIQLYDRQVSNPTFPVPGTYLFYKLTVDSSLRSFQAVVQPATRFVNFPFYMSNYTSTYPVNGGKYQYAASSYINSQTWCIQLSYPYPGSYRLGVSTSAGYNYTIQFVENGLNSCGIEY